MNCWKCKKALPSEMVKISFRAICPNCGFDLHTCVGCRYYSPGKPNDCLVPGTEFIRDRERANFCEEFKVQIESSPSNIDTKKKFDSLFNDE